MKMRGFSIAFLALITVALVIGCSDDKGTNGGVDTNNVVWVDSVSGSVGYQAVIDVNFKNSTAIVGAEVPLRLSGAGFTIDSGSFVGSRFAAPLLKTCTVDQEAKTAIFLVVGSSNVAAGEGKLASLYVTCNEGAAGTNIAIDSAFIQVEGSLYHVVSYVESDLGQVLPSFIRGNIEVPE